MNLRNAARARFGAALGLAVMVAWAAPAHAAAVVYDFVFTESGPVPGSAGSFSGTLTVDNGEVVGITGSGSAIGNILGILPPLTLGDNDNLFPLTFNGITFAVDTGGPVNLYADSGDYFTLNAAGFGGVGTLTLTEVVPPAGVPEPLSLALFGMGLAGLGLVQRRSA